MFMFSSSPETSINTVLKKPWLNIAFQELDRLSKEIMLEHIRICEIPAPTFAETERAQYFYQRFCELGLKDTKIDKVGNVTACWPRASDSYICISAHLDTVFPINTNCQVKKVNERYFAPGIADNAAGLAELLTLAKILTTINIIPNISILFVATVGEEGIGDLMGVKYLFKESEYKNSIRFFISFDGAGLTRITHQALGSKRYKITFLGSGGHSWADFGIANPVHALGRAVAKMASYKVPRLPATAYNVGVIEGGSSVNTIAEQAQMQVDLRSTAASELEKLERHLFRSLEEALVEENQASKFTDNQLTMKIDLIGDRPSGTLSTSSKLVQTALAATKLFGITPCLDCSSTDANIPISLGLEAITLGTGGSCGAFHTLSEWYEETDRTLSLKRTLLLILALAEIN